MDVNARIGHSFGGTGIVDCILWWRNEPENLLSIKLMISYKMKWLRRMEAMFLWHISRSSAPLAVDFE